MRSDFIPVIYLWKEALARQTLDNQAQNSVSLLLMNFTHPILEPLMRRIGCVMMALALFLVTGGHWAMLQGVAWATMVKDFSRTGSLTLAVGKTFDGKHPCPMCKKIASARTIEEKAPLTVKIDKKAEVFLASASTLIPLPVVSSCDYPPHPFLNVPEQLSAPPVPVPIAA